MKKIKELLLKYKEVIMYLIFGVATTLVNWIVYSLLMKTSVVNMTVSNAIAWFTAVVFAYITNKLFVFESRSWNLTAVWKEVVKFFGARIATGVIEKGEKHMGTDTSTTFILYWCEAKFVRSRGISGKDTGQYHCCNTELRV